MPQEKIAFFDVDTQFDFMDKKGALYVPGAEKIIPNLKKLTSLAFKKHIPVISSTDAHSEKDKEFKIFPEHCVTGARGQKKIKQTLLNDRTLIRNKKYSRIYLSNRIKDSSQIIIEKSELDVFSNSNTIPIVKNFSRFYVYGWLLNTA